MVSEITNSDGMMQQLLLMQLQSDLNKADNDGIKGLSKDEINSIKTGDDSNAFLKSLTEQFDTLDADKNGQLSMDEINSVIQKQMGPPVGMSISSDEKDDTKSYSSLLDALTQASYDALDKNEDGVVSLDELQSAYDNQESSNTISDFIKNFDEYDKNQDGSLSSDEFSKAVEEVIKNGDAEAYAGDESFEFKDKLKNLASTFMQKLIDTYKDGGLNAIKSTLSSIV